MIFLAPLVMAGAAIITSLFLEDSNSDFVDIKIVSSNESGQIVESQKVLKLSQGEEIVLTVSDDDEKQSITVETTANGAESDLQIQVQTPKNEEGEKQVLESEIIKTTEISKEEIREILDEAKEEII